LVDFCLELLDKVSVDIPARFESDFHACALLLDDVCRRVVEADEHLGLASGSASSEAVLRVIHRARLVLLLALEIHCVMAQLKLRRRMALRRGW